MVIELTLLHRYLSAPSSEALSAAFEMAESLLSSLRSRTKNDCSRTEYITELVYQFLTHLTTLHLFQKQPYKPRLLREKLEAMIQAFPQNSLFLSTYAEIFKHQSQLDEKIRRTIRWPIFAAPEETNTAAWTVAIGHEIERYRAQTGSTAENVRAMFQRALLGVGSPVAHAPGLWTMWYTFEKMVLEELLKQRDLFGGAKHARKEVVKQAARIRQVFLDGLRYLPWLKEWVLLGLRTFDRGRDDELSWSIQDLRGLYNVLHERELRVRTAGLEEFLEELMDEAASKERK